jgi:hypothetical protein
MFTKKPEMPRASLSWRYSGNRQTSDIVTPRDLGAQNSSIVLRPRVYLHPCGCEVTKACIMHEEGPFVKHLLP